MGVDYGTVSRALVSFDAVLLSAVVEGLQQTPTAPDRCRCPINPLAFRPTLRHDSVTMRFSAAAQVLLAEQWVADRAEEGDPLATLLRPIARPYVHTATATMDDFGAQTALLDNFARHQAALERHAPDPWRAARPTADALQAVFTAIPELPGTVPLDEGQRQALAGLGQALGRLIYGIDAIEDLEDDRRGGAFNPCLIEGDVDASRLSSCQEMIEDAFEQIGDALADLPWQRNHELLQNVLLEQQRRKYALARSQVSVPSPPWWMVLWGMLLGFWARLSQSDDDLGEEEQDGDSRRRRKRKRKRKRRPDGDDAASGCADSIYCCDCDVGCCPLHRDRDGGCCDLDLPGPCDLDCCPCDGDGCGCEPDCCACDCG